MAMRLTYRLTSLMRMLRNRARLSATGAAEQQHADIVSMNGHQSPAVIWLLILSHAAAPIPTNHRAASMSEESGRNEKAPRTDHNPDMRRRKTEPGESQ
jgi:hypothetical protein